MHQNNLCCTFFYLLENREKRCMESYDLHWASKEQRDIAGEDAGAGTRASAWIGTEEKEIKMFDSIDIEGIGC